MVVPPLAALANAMERAERGSDPARGHAPAALLPPSSPLMADATSTPTATPPSSPAAPRASFAEDFIDIFYAPSQVFARRRAASPWPVILVVTGLVAVAAYIYFTLLGPVLERDMARTISSLPEEQRGAAAAFGRWSTLFAVVFGVPLISIVLGLVVWLLGKLFDAEQPFRAAVLVVAFSWMPRVLESILGALQAFVMDVNAIPSLAAASFSPARFMDAATNPAIAQALMRFSPFVIWSYVIIAIGVAVTGRITRGKAAIVAIIAWVVGTIPVLLTLARGTPG